MASAVLQRQISGAGRLNIAIIGSGPAGFYTAHKILQTLHDHVEIDIIESLPFPYGLVRYGIAPDHPEAKNVQQKFDKVARHPNVRFWGNVSLGKHLQLDDLRKHYDSVVLAFGASRDRTLGLERESEMKGVYGSRQFVNWYNGYPKKKNANDVDDIARSLTMTDTAVLVGVGNVALDIARFLLSPHDHMAKTDVAESALEALKQSKIKRVVMLARRSPVHVSFTAKELREMFSLPQTKCLADLELIKKDISNHSLMLSKDRARTRLMSIFESKLAEQTVADTEKSWDVRFHTRPIELKASSENEGHIGSVTCLDTHHDKTTSIDTGLLVKCIGYEMQPIPGLPFDKTASLIPNKHGRIVPSAEDGEHEDKYAGMYVSGWLKTGPRGTIATTMMHSYETSAAIIQDYEHQAFRNPLSDGQGRRALEKLIHDRKVPVVTFDDWKLIEAEEKRRGTLSSKSSEKITDIDEILSILGKK